MVWGEETLDEWGPTTPLAYGTIRNQTLQGESMQVGTLVRLDPKRMRSEAGVEIAKARGFGVVTKVGNDDLYIHWSNGEITSNPKWMMEVLCK